MNNDRASRSTLSARPRGGRHDHVFFSMQTKTADGDSVASTLCKLGAVSCSGVNPVEVSKPLPQPVAPVFVDKSPVYLEVEHVNRIHEPDEGSPSVNIDLSEEA